MPTLVMTIHSTFLGWNADGQVFHADYSTAAQGGFVHADPDAMSLLGQDGRPIASIAPHETGFSLKSNGGKFFCAVDPGTAIEIDRDVAAWWEVFFLVPEDTVRQLADFNQSIPAELERFRLKVEALNAAGEPVKIYCGCGGIPKPGFLNLDIVVGAPEFSMSNPSEYFIFPFVDVPWPIPDGSVDYICHEDFIEHITQLQQIQFLAETLRVMKPGSCHRVNTPNLIEAMRRHSDFSKGLGGVYTGELQWGHISIFTHESLREIAEMVGYSKLVFTKKSEGTSPYAVAEYRPGGDRDQERGSVFADLFK